MLTGTLSIKPNQTSTEYLSMKISLIFSFSGFMSSCILSLVEHGYGMSGVVILYVEICVLSIDVWT